jgi:hypothetical protein
MEVFQRMLHTTARERYQKLKRVFSRLMKSFNRDDLDDFIQTANSLREWIQRDQTLTSEQKAAAEALAVPESLDWQVCHEIANHQKHAGAKPRSKARPNPNVPTVKAVRVAPGGTGFVLPPSMQVIGAGEDITVECDGNAESALAFAIRIFRHFHYIFEVTPLPLAQRAGATTMTAEFFGF